VSGRPPPSRQRAHTPDQHRRCGPVTGRIPAGHADAVVPPPVTPGASSPPAARGAATQRGLWPASSPVPPSA
jgi:hypothetical protein